MNYPTDLDEWLKPYYKEGFNSFQFGESKPANGYANINHSDEKETAEMKMAKAWESGYSEAENQTETEIIKEEKNDSPVDLDPIIQQHFICSKLVGFLHNRMSMLNEYIFMMKKANCSRCKTVKENIHDNVLRLLLESEKLAMECQKWHESNSKPEETEKQIDKTNIG